MVWGTSNAVNVTDGLDGLAAGSASFGFIAFTVIAAEMLNSGSGEGQWRSGRCKICAAIAANGLHCFPILAFDDVETGTGLDAPGLRRGGHGEGARVEFGSRSRRGRS
jgi:hypothetical protein